MISLQLIRIRTDVELMWYKDIWDEILATEDNDNPFIEFAWFYNWWQIVGRRERVELYAVEENGAIIAFFPFLVRLRWGVRIYAFVGENMANYSGIVAKKEWLLPATSFVFDQLIEKYKHLLFSFHGLLESKDSTKVLEQYFIERQLRPRIFRVVTPYLAFHEVDFSNYLNQRRKMHGMDRREQKLRRLGSLKRKIPSRNELWQMFRLFDRRWAKKIASDFTKGKKKDFFERLAFLKGEALQVEVDALVFEDQWIAFTYGICCRGRYVTYALAHEPTFNLFEPGRLVNQETIKRTHSENYHLFDMSIGYEPYKFDWRSNIDFTRRMLVSNGTKRAKLLAYSFTLKERLKEFLKGNHRVMEWKLNRLGQLRYLVKYGKVKDWLEYGQLFVEKFIRFKQVDLYELSPSDSVVPHRPVGVLFEELSIQEAMQLDDEEIISLFYKGYTIYKDSFADTNKPAFALHAMNWRVDALQIVEALPKQTYFLTYDVYKNIDIITAFFQKMKPAQTLWVTASLWQWRKRKQLLRLGYKRISRMKHFKCARYERNHAEKYTESGGDVHSVH
ncbi:GNAT family N-acetyltransferase [Lysinibacillus sp. BPa_S21]|uniref:GNAT family N-acetyltransferase n=1 Tax=Lysinibacillus sp. BPa_S21 TaxID=2932478 RepID=UPI002012EB58|nr:GNAT family N-acetyltransferase [Lysinibacillus sp. BPa_S21]MCL1697378.1 GNAT family N-acetyltransferase [Lysinibacillus sp. BPa_S21]